MKDIISHLGWNLAAAKVKGKMSKINFKDKTVDSQKKMKPSSSTSTYHLYLFITYIKHRLRRSSSSSYLYLIIYIELLP